MSNNPNDSNQQSSQNFSSFGSFSSFGQFGQAGTNNLNTHWGFAPPAEASGTPEQSENKEKSPAPESHTASLSSNFDAFIDSPKVETKMAGAVDSDSFLAEPSMTAAEFDSTFMKESEVKNEDEEDLVFDDEILPSIEHEQVANPESDLEPEVIEPTPEPEIVEPEPEDPETISLTSPDTIPQLIEESEKSSPFLESPQSTLIEDAVADGSFPASEETDEFEVIDAAEFMGADFEEIKEEEKDALDEVKEEFDEVLEEADKANDAIFEEAIVEEPVAEEKEPKTPKAKKVASATPTPKAKTETPKAKTETPKAKTDTPKAKIETPKAKIETPKAKTETPKVLKPKSPAKSASKSPKKSQADELAAEGTRHSGRQRTTVQRLEAETVTSKKDSISELVIPKGSGARLGDIASVAKAINAKVAADEHVILLHRVLFDRMGDASKRKANIRAFCGLEATQEDGTKVFELKLKKHSVADLKNLAILLCLPSAREKTSLIARIGAFLAQPSAEGVKAVKAPKPVKVVKPKLTNRAAALKRKNSQESIGDAVKKPRTAKPAPVKVTKSRAKKALLPQESFLTPETVESDIDSDVEREVLEEIKNA